ncbi:MAG: F0F1 ATP synthase subunit gamma [Actinomycetota bacterium]|nr:F0F1 ATP synthase subunit gamma [Actinomycetota bacterium]
MLRRRIKSVQSTKKITKAMEMIAASRVVKAQQRVAAARPYAEQMTEVIRQLAASGVGLDNPMLSPREEVRTAGFVVITADRGLAGAYNSSVNRRAEREIRAEQDKGRDYSLAIAGRKGEGYFRYRGYRVDYADGGFSEQPNYEDARRLGERVIERFREGEIDQVDIVYTRFLSVGSQKVTSTRLLPLEKKAIEDMAEGGPESLYEFEPDPEAILDRLLPRYVQSRVFAAMLDAAASEHAARQRAMKSATDNAEDLIGSLSVQANKVRQAGITTEIMEVVGGAEALRGSGHSHAQ